MQTENLLATEKGAKSEIERNIVECWGKCEKFICKPHLQSMKCVSVGEHNRFQREFRPLVVCASFSRQVTETWSAGGCENEAEAAVLARDAYVYPLVRVRRSKLPRGDCPGKPVGVGVAQNQQCHNKPFQYVCASLRRGRPPPIRTEAALRYK